MSESYNNVFKQLEGLVYESFEILDSEDSERKNCLIKLGGRHLVISGLKLELFKDMNLSGFLSDMQIAKSKQDMQIVRLSFIDEEKDIHTFDIIGIDLVISGSIDG